MLFASCGMSELKLDCHWLSWEPQSCVVPYSTALSHSEVHAHKTKYTTVGDKFYLSLLLNWKLNKGTIFTSAHAHKLVCYHQTVSLLSTNSFRNLSWCIDIFLISSKVLNRSNSVQQNSAISFCQRAPHTTLSHDWVQDVDYTSSIYTCQVCTARSWCHLRIVQNKQTPSPMVILNGAAHILSLPEIIPFVYRVMWHQKNIHTLPSTGKWLHWAFPYPYWCLCRHIIIAMITRNIFHYPGV